MTLLRPTRYESRPKNKYLLIRQYRSNGIYIPCFCEQFTKTANFIILFSSHWNFGADKGKANHFIRVKPQETVHTTWVSNTHSISTSRPRKTMCSRVRKDGVNEDCSVMYFLNLMEMGYLLATSGV